MNIKKILSLVMAIAMTLSLAATALATDLDEAPTAAAATATEHAAQYTGNTEVPVVNLVVTGTNSTMAFNPYKLAVKVNAQGVPDSNGTNTANDQFITKEIVIQNRTNVPLKLEGSLKVTPYLGDGAPEGAAAASLSNKAIAATETAKKLYVYADFYAYDDTYANVPDTTKTASSGARLTAASAGTAVKHAANSRVVMQATAGTEATQNYVYVKVNGEATNAPTTPWGAYDKVQIDLVFSFQSQPNFDKYAVVNKPTETDGFSDFTVKPTYSKSDVKVTVGNDATDLAKGVTANAVAGYTCYITPNTGKQITAVKFYDKTGTTAITTVKATSTNTKDKTAPWTFTMPAENVIVEVTGGDVSST